MTAWAEILIQILTYYFEPNILPGEDARAQSLQIELIVAPTYSWSMIFSKIRFPLFRIML